MNLNELIKEIRQYLDILNVKQMAELDGDTISRLAMKIASYKSTLGHHVFQQQREANEAERLYIFKRETIFKEQRESGKTIAEADNAKRLEADDLYQEWIKADYNFRVLQGYHRDLETLIDTLRSRLSYMKFRDDL